MKSSCNTLIVDWQEWLEVRGQLRSDCIVISDVPVNFQFLDVFLPAISMLSNDGFLSLVFNADFLDFRYSASLADRVSKYGFMLQANGSSGVYLCFKFSSDQKFDGIWLSGSGFYSDEARNLFSKVFKSEISREYWDWKYPRSVFNYSVSAFKNQNMVAYYGVSQRLLHARRELLKSAQIGDVMVEESCRGGIRSSIFSAIFKYTTAPLPHHNEGFSYSSRPLVGFGFPHGRHMKLGLRIRAYKNGGKLHQVEIFAGGRECKRFVKSDGANLRSSWDLFWGRMLDSAAEFCILDRSWEYFIRRYRNHPEKSYDIYVGDDSIFVLSTGSVVPAIIDYIGDVSSFISESRKLVDSAGLPTIRAWMTDWQVGFFSDFSGFISKDSSASFAILYDDEGYFSQYSETPWWISMGDADFT